MNRVKTRVILIIFGISLGIIAIESLLFILDKPYFYKSHSHPPQFVFLALNNKDFIYFNVPSQRIRFIYDGNPRGYFGGDNEVDHITNSLGFRGKEFSLEKPEDTFRISFLGDSFTFGEGVHLADIYPELVSLILNQKYKSLPVEFESYNFGVGGYNTTQVLFVLKNLVLKTNPDVVVLKYDVADAEPSLFEIDTKNKQYNSSPEVV